MADDKEKNRRTKKRSRKPNPKRDVNEEYELTDQEIAEELINDDIEQNEQPEEDSNSSEMNVNNLFTPSEVEEELADELVTGDIEEDDDLSEGDLGLPKTDNEDVFPGEDDDEIAEEFAELAADEESE